jgi:hypothetical protein
MWECTGIVKEINLKILTDLRIFNTPHYKRAISGMSSVSYDVGLISTWTAGSDSYSALWSFPIPVQYSVNLNIPIPYTGTMQMHPKS